MHVPSGPMILRCNEPPLLKQYSLWEDSLQLIIKSYQTMALSSCPQTLEEFTCTNGIKHSCSSPYHPATNDEAERFVRTFKEAKKTGKGDRPTLTHRLQNFLLTYRTTPHSTTGIPPCDLLMGRRLCTHWDLLKPDIAMDRMQYSSWNNAHHVRQGRGKWIWGHCKINFLYRASFNQRKKLLWVKRENVGLAMWLLLTWIHTLEPVVLDHVWILVSW